MYFSLCSPRSRCAFLPHAWQINTLHASMRGNARIHTDAHNIIYENLQTLELLGVYQGIGTASRHFSFWSFFLTDLLTLDGFQVLSCLSAPRVTFSKLYIQNEIPSLQECTIWEWSQNLEDTFPTLRGFSNTHWDMQCMIYFFSPLPILLPHCFFIVIPHFTSHSTSNIGPRFQFVVWPFLSYILQQSANSAVLLGLPGKVHLSSSE